MQVFNGDLSKRLGAALLLILLATILVLQVFGLEDSFVYNPPYLVLILEVIFVLGTSLVVAAISARSYLQSGLRSLIYIADAIAIFGIVNTIPFIPLGWSSNTMVTLSNLGTLISAVVLFWGSIVVSALEQFSHVSIRKTVLSASFIGTFLLITALLGLVLSGWLPVFLTSEGPTLIRLVTLGAIGSLFFASSFLLFRQYLRVKSPVLYWYSLALALLGIVFASAFFVTHLGDTMTWVTRLALYLSGIYFVVALLAPQLGGRTLVPISEKWAESFRGNRRQVDLLFKNMSDAFAYCRGIYDVDGSPIDYLFIDINEPFIAYTNHGREIIGRKASEVSKDFTGLSQNIGNVISTGRPMKSEVYFESLRRWFAVSGYSPEKGFCALVMADITERKRIEEELEESYRLLEKRVEERTETIKAQADLLNITNDAILVIDLENLFLYWNKGAERMYGWTSEEVLGRDATGILKNDPQPIADAVKSTVTSGQWLGEIKQKTKDGRDIIVESRWTPVFDADKKPKSIMTINTDITEKKQLEAQYLRAQRLESLGTLAGGIAHDFRNILTPVTVSLGLIDQHLTAKEDHELIAMLQKNLQRGADLSGQLLTFARGIEGERTAVPVLALISDVERTIKATFPKSIHIETTADSALPAVNADSTQIHQVLINMCINARDAMPFGGRLNITAENASVDQYYARLHSEAKVGSYVVISVTDDGVGMPPEVLDHIFEPFFTTKKQGEGTGLGLSTARSIVKSHGGFINVYSEVGKGSTFKIYLPTGEANGEQQISEVNDPVKGKGQLILLVDDEEVIRKAGSAALEANGYRTLQASDGAEALAVYMKHEDEIKAVLLDMAMPVMDGEATIRALKKIDPEVKIIGMSGLAENGKYRTMRTVTSAFITKPFTADKLLGALGKVLAN